MAEQKEKRWYCVQTYSGKEDQVKDNLKSRITSMNMQEQIFQVIVPEQIIQEKKEDGSIKEKVVKVFPGYVFVEMIDNDDSWWVVRNTPQVTGFLGSSGKKARPSYIPEYEMEPILKMCGVIKAKEINFQVGDTVTCIAGTFKDSTGVVEEIDLENNQVTIEIEMFQRLTSVTVGIDEVNKND